MKIKSSFKLDGEVFIVDYEDLDDFSSLPRERCKQIYGVCFVGNEIVIVRNGVKNAWGLPGGSIEEGETPGETFRREMAEEANAEVLKWLPIGVQKVTFADGHFILQLRACASVAFLGDFVSDPGGNVAERRLIDPTDYKEYFDWGEVGDRIIKRGLELKKFV